MHHGSVRVGAHDNIFELRDLRQAPQGIELVLEGLAGGGRGLTDFAGGLFKGLVFGVLVALAGCLRGLQSGRSSAAVGRAATSAVVTGIVWIVVADAILTLIYDRLQI